MKYLISTLTFLLSVPCFAATPVIIMDSSGESTISVDGAGHSLSIYQTNAAPIGEASTSGKQDTQTQRLDSILSGVSTLHSDSDGVEALLGSANQKNDLGNDKLSSLISGHSTLHNDVDGVEALLTSIQGNQTNGTSKVQVTNTSGQSTLPVFPASYSATRVPATAGAYAGLGLNSDGSLQVADPIATALAYGTYFGIPCVHGQLFGTSETPACLIDNPSTSGRDCFITTIAYGSSAGSANTVAPAVYEDSTYSNAGTAVVEQTKTIGAGTTPAACIATRSPTITSWGSIHPMVATTSAAVILNAQQGPLGWFRIRPGHRLMFSITASGANTNTKLLLTGYEPM